MSSTTTTNAGIQRFANNVGALTQPGAYINTGVNNVLNVAERAGQVFHRTRESGVSLGAFSNGEGFNKFKEFSEGLLCQASYGVCKAFLNERIASYANVNDKIRQSLALMLPDENEFFRLTTGASGDGVALVDSAGRKTVVAAINPTITCFDKNQGNKQYAILYVKFIEGVNPLNPRASIVQVVMSVCAIDFSLAPNWHIQTVTSNKNSLFVSSSSSTQSVVYTPASYTHATDQALQHMLESRMSHTFEVLGKFDTFFRQIGGPESDCRRIASSNFPQECSGAMLESDVSHLGSDFRAGHRTMQPPRPEAGQHALRSHDEVNSYLQESIRGSTLIGNNLNTFADETFSIQGVKARDMSGDISFHLSLAEHLSLNAVAVEAARLLLIEFPEGATLITRISTMHRRLFGAQEAPRDLHFMTVVDLARSELHLSGELSVTAVLRKASVELDLPQDDSPYMNIARAILTALF